MTTTEELLKQLDNTDLKSTEPVTYPILMTNGAIVLVASIIHIFVPNAAKELVSAISVTTLLVANIILAFLIRRKVWSPASVVRVTDAVALEAKAEALEEGFNNINKKIQERHPDGEDML